MLRTSLPVKTQRRATENSGRAHYGTETQCKQFISQILETGTKKSALLGQKHTKPTKINGSPLFSYHGHISSCEKEKEPSYALSCLFKMDFLAIITF